MNECSDPEPPDITSTGELRDALHRVLRAAESNDVTFRGTWSIPAPDDDARWLVDVARGDRRETITPDAFPATAIVRAIAEREGVPTTTYPRCTRSSTRTSSNRYTSRRRGRRGA